MESVFQFITKRDDAQRPPVCNVQHLRVRFSILYQNDPMNNNHLSITSGHNFWVPKFGRCIQMFFCTLLSIFHITSEITALLLFVVAGREVSYFFDSASTVRLLQTKPLNRSIEEIRLVIVITCNYGTYL